MNTRQQRIQARVQPSQRKYWLRENGKYLLVMVLVLVVLGLIGHRDVEALMLDHANYTCRYQTTDTIPTFNQCIDNQLENTQ